MLVIHTLLESLKIHYLLFNFYSLRCVTDNLTFFKKNCYSAVFSHTDCNSILVDCNTMASALWKRLLSRGVSDDASGSFEDVLAATVESQQYTLRAAASQPSWNSLGALSSELRSGVTAAATANAAWMLDSALTAEAALGCILSSRIAREGEPGATSACAVGASVLHVAACAGNVHLIARVLKHVTEVRSTLEGSANASSVAPVARALDAPLLWRDSDCSAAVHEAAISGKTVAMVALIRAAAAVSAKDEEREAAAAQTDEEGRTVLCWRRGDGASIVHCAALGGHLATMEMALALCAHARAVDETGRGALAWRMNDGASPLHVAAFVSSLDCTAALLKAGADPRALTAPSGRKGTQYTPYDIATNEATALRKKGLLDESAAATAVAAMLKKGADSTLYLNTLESWGCRKLGDFVAEHGIGVLGLAARAKKKADVKSVESSAAGGDDAVGGDAAGGDASSEVDLERVLARALELGAKVVRKYHAAVVKGTALALDAALSPHEVRLRIVVQFEEAMDSITRPGKCGELHLGLLHRFKT